MFRRWLFTFLLLVPSLALAGCDTTICVGDFCFGGSGGTSSPPTDSPGTLQAFNITDFTYRPSLCGFPWPCLAPKQYHYTPLTQTYHWQGLGYHQDGIVNGAWTTDITTVSKFLAMNANLAYIMV